MMCRVYRVSRQGRSMKGCWRLAHTWLQQRRQANRSFLVESIGCSSSAVLSQLPEEPRAWEQSIHLSLCFSIQALELHHSRQPASRQQGQIDKTKAPAASGASPNGNSQRLFDNLKLQEEPCVFLPCMEHCLL